MYIRKTEMGSLVRDARDRNAVFKGVVFPVFRFKVHAVLYADRTTGRHGQKPLFGVHDCIGYNDTHGAVPGTVFPHMAEISYPDDAVCPACMGSTVIGRIGKNYR